MKIIPIPQNQEIFEEKITFSSSYRLSLPEDYQTVENYINTFLKASPDAKNEIILKCDSSLSDEEYKLEISEDITIFSSCAKGAFRAASTLKQLVGYKCVNKQKIHDYPDVKNRGLMLDISRGRNPKLETLYTLVDILSDLKYNQFQLYIDAPIFEYAHFMEHCKNTTPLTVDELKKLIIYCKERFIELVPNQNSFGHMSGWLSIPEFSELGIKKPQGTPDSLNPLDEKSLEFVDKLYSDMLPYFDSELVNIGMDETFSLGLGQTEEACKKYGKGKVYVDFLNKVIKLAKEKYNKTPMFWDDIVFNHTEVIPDVSKDAIFLEWGYEHEMEYLEKCRILSENNLRFYNCPSTCTFQSITGRFENMTHNIEAAVKACLFFGGEGVLLTEWGDGGHPQTMPTNFLGYAFCACCMWNYEPMVEKPFIHCTYVKSSPIMVHIQQYLDKFVFDENPVSLILQQMGNYYLLENMTRWSGTGIWIETDYILKGKEYYSNYESAEMVMWYMEKLKDKLEELPKNTPFLEDIILNCNMVIVFSRFMMAFIKKTGEKIENPQLKSDLVKLKKDFIENWNKENKEYGSHLLTRKIDKMIDAIN